MLDALGQIRNPWLRSLTVATTVGSIMTLGAAVTIGVTGIKGQSIYRTSVYTALLGITGGAIVGLLTRPQATSQSMAQSRLELSSGSLDWTDWRDFVVDRKVKESEEITSFYLKPVDRGLLPSFKPGQFLTIKLNIPGQAQPVIRTYSLSDDPAIGDYYRLSIKREPAPKDTDLPPGLASNFMHDQIQVGSVIPAKPPNGRFILDVQKSLPAVLISNGVGITPMISMAKAVSRLNPDRPIWFLHGARDGRFHAFRDEILELAQKAPNLHIHFAYSRPREEDADQFHSQGYVDTALVEQLLGQQEAEYFLCGSPAFMTSLREGFKHIGVTDDRVFFEAFSKGTSPAKKTAVADMSPSSQGVEVVFSASEKTVNWQPHDGSLLEFAEAHDVNPLFSCRQGICGTCRCALLDGDVDYAEPPVAGIEPGTVLICVAKPRSKQVVLEI